MAPSSCSEEQYHSPRGRCCRRCEAGTYKQKDCDETSETQCGDCGRDFFTATLNHMEGCRECTRCNANNKLVTKEECTASRDTICDCEAGFYCSEDSCRHCLRVSPCPKGQGVKTLATRRNDTVCSPCQTGTFSNVSDHLSVCRPHTRCEDIGRELLTEGTNTTDAICGNFKTSCGWMLPAGLWLGLVLTSLILFALVLFCWRVRRYRLPRTVNLSRPEAAVGKVLAEEVELKLSLPSKELNVLYQEETYKPSYSCELPAFESVAMVTDSCEAQDTDHSSIPITPLKASVSFTEPQPLSHNGHGSANYHRTMSEPQEDEWCGT